MLVVGGTSGLGRAVAVGFLAQGYEVAVLSRSASGLPVSAGGRSALALGADITDAGETAAAFAALVEAYGGLDVAVNTAGIVGTVGAVADTAPEELDRVVEVNLVGIHRAMTHEARLMRPNGGVIINVSSNIGPHAIRPGMGAYAASKAALTALSRTAALELARERIRVSVLSPGASDTAMSIRPGEDRAGRDARMAASHPLGRVVALSEVIAAVRYLASTDAAATLGADLVLDGGQSL